jgi:hypothetical protein
MIAGTLLLFGCGGFGDGNGGAEASDGAASTGSVTAAATGSTSEDPTATGGGSEGSSGGAQSSGEASGGSSTGDHDPGIELGCMGMDGVDPEDDGVICFYDIEDPGEEPTANLVYELVDLDGQPAIYLRLIFAPWFADNTYGENAIGWPNGHKFRDLVGSDHAELVMRNKLGEEVLHFKLDYISEDMDIASGYRAMGPWDGEGDLELGDPAWILAANSSISRNLNERGYDTYLVDSPATDEDYTPNPAAPNWDFRVVYEVWVDPSAFDDEGDGALAQACVQFIHASPSKLEDNTSEVIPDSCPPGWGCFEEDGCHCESSSADPDANDDCDPGSGYPPVP